MTNNKRKINEGEKWSQYLGRGGIKAGGRSRPAFLVQQVTRYNSTTKSSIKMKTANLTHKIYSYRAEMHIAKAILDESGHETALAHVTVAKYDDFECEIAE